MMVFETDYDEIEIQNIVMTSFQWRQHHYVTEKRHKNFLIWAPLNQNFWLRQWSWFNKLMFFKKAVLKK